MCCQYNYIDKLNYIDFGVIKMSIYQIVNEHARTLPFFLHSIGDDLYQNPMYRPNGFPYSHMITVLDGDGIVECEGFCESVSKGDIFFIKKNIPHKYFSYGKTFQTRWITFDGTACDAIFSSQNITNFKLFKDVDIAKLNTHFDNLYNKSLQYINGYELSVHIYSYIINFFNCNKKHEFYDNMQDVINYIKHNYSKCITLEELSEISAMNKFTFCREFKKIYNSTPFEFILQTRIQNAKTLLTDSNMQIQEIAEKVGFNDTGYFCRIFKKEENCTPSEFKKIIKKPLN